MNNVKLTGEPRLVEELSFIAPAVKDGVKGVAIWTSVDEYELEKNRDTGNFEYVCDWDNPDKFEPADETGWVY